jgi:hypothetical protein
MEQNLVDAELTPAEAAEINAALETIKSKTSFTISLSTEERISLLKMGDNFRQFTEKAVNVIAEHPEIMPATFNSAEFKKDFDLMKSLEPISQKLTTILQAINDTILAAGSDSLTEALEVYSEVKAHTEKIPGLNTVYTEMKLYFPRKKRAALAAAQAQTN